MTEVVQITKIKLQDIKIGNRFRKDFGDINSLAKSIEEIGLLHPIVINEDNELIAGNRRIEAVKKLGWTEIPFYQVNIEELRKGELHENVVRKDFLPDEHIAIKRELEPELFEEAQERYKQTVGRPKKGTEKIGAESAAISPKETRQVLADFLGISHDTLAKEEMIVEAAEKDPEKFGKYLDKIKNKEISVNGAAKQINAEIRLQQVQEIIDPQTDREICDKLGIRLKPFDAHWNFELDDRFNVEYPGKIPAGILFGCLYFFTKQGDLVVDPMAGSGAMGKVCKTFKRRCLMYDINPFDNEIKQHDILKGLPKECKGAELLFWDPPYYKKLVEEYGPNSISAMSRSDFLNVFGMVAADAAKKDIEKIALLVSNYDDVYYSNPSESVSIHDYVEAIRGKSDWCWYREIQCPLTTQQIDPKRYDTYLENRKLFGLGRTLIIFSRGI